MQLTKFSFLLATIVAALLGAACAPGSIPFLGGGGSAQQRQQSYRSESSSETINGQQIDDRDDGGSSDRGDRDDDKRTASRGEDLGATCTKNSECGARACYVGAGELGYCTRICDSFADCPMGWDCQRAGNAPQKICQQDQD